jgi:hypothetical protein
MTFAQWRARNEQPRTDQQPADEARFDGLKNPQPKPHHSRSFASRWRDRDTRGPDIKKRQGNDY